MIPAPLEAFLYAAAQQQYQTACLGYCCTEDQRQLFLNVGIAHAYPHKHTLITASQAKALGQISRLFCKCFALLPAMAGHS
jgi:hypothetical protein